MLMKHALTSSLTILLALTAATSASAFDRPNLTPQDLMTLQSGQPTISVYKDKTQDHHPTISTGGIDIMASADDVLALVKDCGPVSKFSKDIRDCQILDQGADGSWDIRKEKFAVSPVLPKFKSTFRTNYTTDAQQNHVLQVMRISGDLKVQDGRWDIISLGPDHCRVVYQAALKPKLPIPGKTIRKQVSIGIPEILQNLRMVAESDVSAPTQKMAQHEQTTQM